VQDYLACANALTRRKVCVLGGSSNDTEQDDDNDNRKGIFLAAKAFSAGGVIIGAAINASPHLFQAVTLTNPFLDVTNTMSDKSLPLTEHEWDEFGNPVDDENAKVAIANYCPFANLRSQQYPPAFLVGALDDENVPFWNPICFGMKMRDKSIKHEKVKSEEHFDVLLHVEEDGGHHLHGKQLGVSELEVCFLLGQYARWKSDNGGLSGETK